MRGALTPAAHRKHSRARSHLLLPATAAPDAADSAERLRNDLLTLRAAQALASWLDQRPQLGRDVFARGQPELTGTTIETATEVDVIGFLWACMDRFEAAAGDLDTTAVYTPPWRNLHTVSAAQERILKVLAETPEGAPLDRLLPEPPRPGATPERAALLRRSAWSSTLVASLELTRQGTVTLQQEQNFGAIQVQYAIQT